MQRQSRSHPVRKGIACAILWGLSVCALFDASANAQVKPRLIQSITTNNLTWGASRVLLVLDSPVPDYVTYFETRKFFLVLPRTTLPQPWPKPGASYIKSIEFAQRGADLVIAFEPDRNAMPRIQQSSTFILVFFSPPGGSSIRQNYAPQVASKRNTVPAAGDRIVLDKTPPQPATNISAPPVNEITRSAPVAVPVPNATGVTEPSVLAGARTLRIPKVSKSPKLEDFLIGRREAEVAVSDFRQLQPGDGQPASRSTKAYLSYDELNLYVVFVCRDEPAKIRAHVSRREDIENDDTVSITLDTYHDRRRAYTFVVNPLGVQLDGIITEGQGTDYSFDTLWKSEGSLTSDGYIVRIAIPFKSLRFSGEQLQTWGIALGRSIIRNNEQAYWPYITERVQGFVQQMATAHGLQQISPGRNIELRPYGAFTSSRTPNSDPAAPRPYVTDKEARVGVDAKVVLRDALTLDFTVNPDFSQVESDEPQVLINQRFEVFFPEKRPFFIENAGFFQTPQQLFFSRRIAEPQFGTRLTGKLGRWALGGLLIDDRAAGKLDLEGPRSSRAVIGVARLQREFAEQSAVGFLVTNRDYRNSSNRVFAVDGRLQLNPNWTLAAQAARSYTLELDHSHTSGSAYLAQLAGSGLNFNYGLTYTDRSPGFRADVGFVPRVDIRQIEQYANYRWRPESRRVVSFGPAGYALFSWDRQGRLQDWYADASFGVQMKRQTFIDIERSEAYELFEGHGFRTRSTNVSLVSDPLEWIGFSASYNSGSSVNYSPALGLLPFEADSSGSNVEITLRPTSRASFYQSYIYRRLATRNNSIVLADAGTSIFNNHILRSKINYQFSRKLSLRFILDYDAVLPNESLVALERTKRFTPDILLTYLVNPGTALYIGYTDRYENLLINPGGFRRIGSPTTPTDRQFFAKISYLFRY